MRQMARELKIENQLRWEGFVPYEHIGAYYHACDVFILPSLEDTWGITVAESMVFGKPVLCSRQAGVRELVQHGKNGFQFDPLRPEELAGYMARFVCEPELMESMGANSRQIISAYTPERTAQVFAGAVSRLTTSARAGFAARAAGKSSGIPS
jgi:glycosyltransferase involved in cell wall biosynthesis